MTPSARWPSVVEEMPGREFHVTGFQRVGWREKFSFSICFHHIAAPCQGILTILEVCLLNCPDIIYFKIQYITFVLWFQVPSTRFISLQTQYWLWINRCEAWPGWLQKSTSVPAQGGKSWWPSTDPGQSEGSVMFAPHRLHSRPYHWKHCVCSEPRQPCASLRLLRPAAAWWSQLHAVPPLRCQWALPDFNREFQKSVGTHAIAARDIARQNAWQNVRWNARGNATQNTR